MKERPILFNTAMVQAILSGRKTQTRRPVPAWQLPSETEGPHDQFPDSRFISVAQLDARYGFGVFGATAEACMDNYNKGFKSLCPFGAIGDRLWVRETWSVISHTFNDDGLMIKWTPDRPNISVREMKHGNGYYSGHVIYKADGGMEWSDDDGCSDDRSHWKPSIHMPRSACRIILEITRVGVERPHDISESDAAAEGFDIPAAPGQGWKFNAKHNFKFTWNTIYQNWGENPWVWVVEFKLLTSNGVIQGVAA